MNLTKMAYFLKLSSFMFRNNPVKNVLVVKVRIWFRMVQIFPKFSQWNYLLFP
jgi:hypothetical protein